MKVIRVSPAQIKYKEGVDRYRQDLGDISGLMDSIDRVGQILPIVINDQHELVDGGRRLASCLTLGIEVKAVMENDLDPVLMREWELEANLHRKDYTPAEEALAIRDLHALKQVRHGEADSLGDGWSLKDTAKTIKKSKTTVANALELANLVDAFPELKKARKKSEIRKAAANLKRVHAAVTGMKAREKTFETQEDFRLIHGNALEHMTTMADGSVDVLMTDPLYGIDADALMQTLDGGSGGANTTAGYKIMDGRDEALLHYAAVAVEGFRFTSSMGHGFIFLAPEHFQTIRELFQEAGWLCFVKPFIWVKRRSGQCNIPHAWPASCYEMCLYIRKQDSVLTKEGMPDWEQCNPVLKKIHPYEKPVPLLRSLLERVWVKDAFVYDPYMGSAATIEAAYSMNMPSCGVEVSQEAYAMACKRMDEVVKGEKNEQSSEQDEDESNDETGRTAA